jgi:hypothetical protein
MQENVGMLAVYPSMPEDEDPVTELIFVVDR